MRRTPAIRGFRTLPRPACSASEWRAACSQRPVALAGLRGLDDDRDVAIERIDSAGEAMLDASRNPGSSAELSRAEKPAPAAAAGRPVIRAGRPLLSVRERALRYKDPVARSLRQRDAGRCPRNAARADLHFRVVVVATERIPHPVSVCG